MFLETFSYCMAALPAARSLPHPFRPVATVTGAMALALVVVGWLIHFIHHISQSISVNHIVDRIARETELVIKELILHREVDSSHRLVANRLPKTEARFLIVSPVISAMNGTASYS